VAEGERKVMRSPDAAQRAALAAWCAADPGSSWWVPALRSSVTTLHRVRDTGTMIKQ